MSVNRRRHFELLLNHLAGFVPTDDWPHAVMTRSVRGTICEAPLARTLGMTQTPGEPGWTSFQRKSSKLKWTECSGAIWRRRDCHGFVGFTGRSRRSRWNKSILPSVRIATGLRSRNNFSLATKFGRFAILAGIHFAFGAFESDISSCAAASQLAAWSQWLVEANSEAPTRLLKAWNDYFSV